MKIKMLLLPGVIFILVLVGWADLIMNQDMINYNYGVCNAIIGDYYDSINDWSPNYNSAEQQEHIYWDRVNSKVSQAKPHLENYISLIEFTLQSNYPGGFAAWRAVNNGQNGSTFDQAKNAKDNYCNEMTNYNNCTGNMIASRQSACQGGLAVLFAIGAEIILFVNPPLGSSVELVVIGFSLLGGNFWVSSLHTTYLATLASHDTSYDNLKCQMMNAAFEGEDLKSILYGTPYWTSDINTEWSEFVGLNIDAQSNLNLEKQYANQCHNYALYTYYSSESAFYGTLYMEK